MTETRAITLITGASAGISAALAHVLAEGLVLTARREAELPSMANAFAATAPASSAIVVMRQFAEAQ